MEQPNLTERGQAIVEYALILVLVGVAVICIIALLTSALKSPEELAAAEFAARDSRVQACVESEQYTREECIALMGQPDVHTTTITMPKINANGGG